jgi:hypothetical protein
MSDHATSEPKYGSPTAAILGSFNPDQDLLPDVSADIVTHAEVVAIEDAPQSRLVECPVRVEPAQLDTVLAQEIERILREHRWLHDVVKMVRKHHRDACRRAADAALVLADSAASMEDRIEARTVLEEFVVEDLCFDDGVVRRRFNPRLLDRIEAFDGLPLWTALTAEILSKRWSRCESDWPLWYLRYAMYLEATRYYGDHLKRLRHRDKRELPIRTLDGATTKKALRAIEVRIDRDTILRRAGAPGPVTALVRYRAVCDDSDSEIAESLGWTPRKLEATQAAWRRTWSVPVRALAVASGYRPRPQPER